MPRKLLDEIQRRLNEKTIHELRQLARAVGVPRPAEGRKERLVEWISDIASGVKDPATPSVRGAHPKSAEYDRQLVADILRCREINLSSASGEEETDYTVMSVASGDNFDPLDYTASGILELTGGKWFMRVNGCRENLCSDALVSEYLTANYDLRNGDFVTGKCKRRSGDEIARLDSLISINGCAPNASRREFEKLTPVYPDRRFVTGNKIYDIFSPIGAGQRAFVIGGHGSGKTAVLKDIARGLQNNNQNLKLIILSIDSSPEEAAEFSRLFTFADVFTSPFNCGSAGHVRTAWLALDYAKRQTELSKDVLIVLDDLTKLTRAFNSCGKQVYAALDSSALDSAKRFLAAAKNAEEGGSLTILTALSGGGSDQVDEAIYSGLKGICNNKITLSSGSARSRVYPPVDLAATGAVGEERLLSDDELDLAYKLRGESLESVINYFKQG